MTGAIAAVLAMPALFDASPDSGRKVTAPPSSLERTLHVPARIPHGSPLHHRARPAVGVLQRSLVEAHPSAGSGQRQSRPSRPAPPEAVNGGTGSVRPAPKPVRPPSPPAAPAQVPVESTVAVPAPQPDSRQLAATALASPPPPPPPPSVVEPTLTTDEGQSGDGDHRDRKHRGDRRHKQHDDQQQLQQQDDGENGD